MNTLNTLNTSRSTSNTINIAISIDFQPSTSLDELSRGSEKAQAPSYAAIVKNYKFQGILGSQQSQKPKTKEPYKPERLKNSQKQSDPIKVYILNLKKLPIINKALLASIISQQQQQSIKAIKRAIKRLLLVYPSTNEAR